MINISNQNLWFANHVSKAECSRYVSLLSSAVERVTSNDEVIGSIPVGGIRRDDLHFCS